MFRRHHTDPNRDRGLVADAFHDRLAASAMTVRTASPQVDPHGLRSRLGASASVGLRDRLGRNLRTA
ncbi:MAG TPA: hypothetical protein VFK35_06535 [Candidatus Limnocylindrales bacterium]|nr:hypothetical protein [Candidatus Limnocylindrales bacterium]